MTATTSRSARLLLAVVALAGACGGGADDIAAPASTTSTTTTTTTTTAVAGAPLTGLPPDPATAGRPALVVKIDNAPLARPQAGINQADVVVEEGVEGGVTRFAAVFHSQDVPSVGPVRSARSTDIVYAGQLGRPLFAYSGANAAFAKLLAESPLRDVGVGRVSAAYGRQPGRPAPYNLFSSTPPLFAAAPADATAPTPLFSYRAVGEPPTGGEIAPVVQALWKDKVTTLVLFSWDAALGGFARTQNDTPHVDTDGTRVAPENVVLQVVPYRNTGLVDRSGAAVPEAELIGEGEAWVLTAGQLIRGRWSRPSPEGATTYTGPDGTPVKLTPGRTWVELVPTGNLSSR